ncbi:MAG TPA: ABC transporter ATP-binding protein, partial [Anaerolineales bacterium]|nr:ABC transporter ATP-binding protein [Anaerolineales bacterium]
DLSKQFNNDFWAVDGVTLNVQPGQILALLGQNGAGKTTTVRMLTSLLAPTRGWARVGGYDVTKNPQDVRANVGVLTEQHGLYMRMTGAEYMEYFGKVYGLDDKTRKQRSEYLLEYFGLADAARKRSGEYSKGMKQKLALARALIHDPAVLLLDEPTSAMDPESAQLVRNEIARLRSSKRTIIICTHNLAEAEALSDRIAIIYRGKILLNGTLDELKYKVLGPVEFEARFAEPFDAGELNLPEGVELASRSESTLRFRVEAPQAVNPKIVHMLTSRNASLVSFQEVTRRLEQVYLKTMADAQGVTHAA